MKRYILSAMSGLLIAVSTMGAIGASAKIDDGATAEEISNMHVISSEGVFTFYERTKTACNEKWFKTVDKSIKHTTKVDDSLKAKPKAGDEGITETIKNMSTNMIETIVTFLVKQLELLFDGNCGKEGSLGIVSQLFVVSKTVNVTMMEGVMKVTAIMQWICLALSLLMIVYYGVTMSTGIQQTPPMVFGIRMFMAFLGVYLAPYLVQDILNINNYIVYTLNKITVTMNNTAMPAEFAFPVALINMFQSLFSLSVYGFIVVIVAGVAVVISLIPLFKLVIWWYVRWFKIMVYTVISPFMFLSIGLRETSRTASGFINTFVTEVFSQTIVVIGIMLVSTMLPTMVQVLNTYRLGAVGVAIALYAMLSFLAQLPDLAGNLIRGDASGFGLKGMNNYLDTYSKKASGKVAQMMDPLTKYENRNKKRKLADQERKADARANKVQKVQLMRPSTGGGKVINPNT